MSTEIDLAHGSPETTREAPEQASLREEIARCVHCGFCLQSCPTYLELGTETDSPRGRLALIDAVASGRAAPTPALLGHLDLCLQCRACETACPSGVAYGHIMETARATVMETDVRPTSWGLRASLLRAVLPHQSRIRGLMTAMRLYQRSPLAAALRKTRVLDKVAPALGRSERSMPRVPRDAFRAPPQPPSLTRSVALLTGCVMPHLYGRTHEATVRVLNRLGYRVVFPEAQTCCGALSMHAGDRRFAQALARRNIAAFLAEPVEAIIVNSAGCGSTMKEYAQLLAGDAGWRAAARRVSELTRDVLEFVAEHDTGSLAPVARTVTYQDSCHLVHAQKITIAPRQLLARIPRLELREMRGADRCCGSAGVYSLVQAEMSQRLLQRKMEDIAQTGATTIATANPGCMMQLEAGLREHGVSARVVHVIELLDEAMRGAPPPAR